MQHSKLADWDDDDPQTIQDTSSRWDKVVILKHMFTLQELEVCKLSRNLVPAARQQDTYFIYRMIQQLSWISKKTFVKNVPKWDRSPMSSSSIKNLVAWQAYVMATLKQLKPVSRYVVVPKLRFCYHNRLSFSTLHPCSPRLSFVYVHFLALLLYSTTTNIASDKD